jgi:hypothetical protein
MPYIKLFETSIKADFEKACAMLERENIKYEALYEYRLEKEGNYDLFGSSDAILSVPRSVYHDADRLLVENKLKEEENSARQRFTFVTKVDTYFSGIPVIRSVPLYGKLLGLLAFTGVLLFLWLLFQHDHNFLNPNEAINRFQVKSIHFEGKEMIPDTKCDYDLGGLTNAEQISFRLVPNDVTLSGFNSERVSAKWVMDEAGGKLVVYDANSYGLLTFCTQENPN